MNLLRMLGGGAPKRAAVSRSPAVLLAHRALAADAMRRLVHREALKARQAARTPEKLRSWMTTFYEDRNRVAMIVVVLPVCSLHVALLDADADEPASVRAKHTVDTHCETSRRALAGILETTSPCDVEGAVSKEVDRWAVDRPGAFADALLAELLAIE